jgi:hypothetical protein
MLRDFLFLNTDVVTSYLSQLEGYSELSVDETTTEQKKKGVSSKIMGTGGEFSGDKTTSTKRNFAVTDEAKFQKLYDILDQRKEIQFLDAFDQKIWDQIRRGEILEIPANLRIPKFLEVSQEVNNFLPLLEIFSPFLENQISKKDEEAITGFSRISQNLEDKPIPLFFDSSTIGFQFFSNVERKYLRCEVNSLQYDATVFGKVHKILDKNQKETVFSITPKIDNTISLNRKQRRSVDKRPKQLEPFKEILKGPAIILIPIAIFL